MRHPSAAFMAAVYRAACRLDVESFKPGNVSWASPGHRMTGADFVRSAEHSAASLVDPGVALGRRILDAVSASYLAVGCNTNLGIVLLVAPLVQCCWDAPGQPLRFAMRRVLDATTVMDTRAVYRAIRLVRPGGLGRVAQHDVSGEANATLREVMALAAQHDLIARQYANGFGELFDVASPYLERALTRRPAAEALTDLFLYLLAQYPDSHIRRRHGDRLAAEVSAHAARLHAAFDHPLQGPARSRAGLQKFDRDLKRRGINPGTTADLCVATYFSHRLLLQTRNHTGPAPDHPRTPRPGRAEVPHFRAAN